jgi:hypothetical protein
LLKDGITQVRVIGLGLGLRVVKRWYNTGKGYRVRVRVKGC